jgi:hypothetical protein
MAAAPVKTGAAISLTVEAAIIAATPAIPERVTVIIGRYDSIDRANCSIVSAGIVPRFVGYAPPQPPQHREQQAA